MNYKEIYESIMDRQNVLATIRVDLSDGDHYRKKILIKTDHKKVFWFGETETKAMTKNEFDNFCREHDVEVGDTKE